MARAMNRGHNMTSLTSTRTFPNCLSA
uniref:Uncharacterized protein n=1 Tax=Anguilla anguilla TaxID=7936 RepID=A0A0E9PFS6_ANGAN